MHSAAFRSAHLDWSYELRDVPPEGLAAAVAELRGAASRGANVTIRGLIGMKFTAPKSACGPCGLRAQCLKHPEKTPVRQVVFFNGRTRASGEKFTTKMKRKIDSVLGKQIYQRRLATVEPVFANLRAAKRLDRFTLRGKTKVNAQWLLYCLVHNLGKIQRYGPALAGSG